MSILVREEYANVTKGYRFGDSGEPQEAFTDDLGRLFRELQREYGKASNVYVDTKAGKVRHIGWCFTKRMKYEDARTDRLEDYYVREVWVTLCEPCDVDAPNACISKKANGAVIHHPFTQIDIDDYRRRGATRSHLDRGRADHIEVCKRCGVERGERQAPAAQ